MIRYLSFVALSIAAVLVGGLFYRTIYRYAEAQAMAGAPPLLDASPSIAAVPPPLMATDMAVGPPPVAAPPVAAPPIVAPAAVVVPVPAPEPSTVLDQVMRDVATGDWRYAAAGCLSLLMLALQRARSKVRWFSGRRGGAVLVMVLALAGSLVTVLASSVPLTPGLLFGAFAVALTAVGGWEWVRALVDRKEHV